MTSAAAAAADAESVDEARPCGIAKYSAKTKSALEVSPGEAGSSGSRPTRVVEVPKMSCQESVDVFAQRWSE